MPVELEIPRVKVPALPMPTYVKLAEAFGVGAGTSLLDKSRYRSHGAITGAVWAAGLHGYCLDFNPALPSHVVIPAAHTQLNFTSRDFSMIVRVKFDSLATHRTILERGAINTDGYLFWVNDAGSMEAYTSQALASQWSNSAAGSIVIDTWYTLGLSRHGASMRLHRNGLDITNIEGVHINPATCARSAKIGIRDDLVGNPADGQMEFLRIFGGIALPASSHLAWHNALA